MHFKNITIHHFRGFEHRDFTFDARMNVILGDNTTGKTTLLHAVQIALGAYLQSLTLVAGSAFSRNFKKTDHCMVYVPSSKSFVRSEHAPSITVTAYNEDSKEEIRWTRIGSKNSRKHAGELIDWVANLNTQRRKAYNETEQQVVLPLFLSFGATRLENNYNGATKTKARASREENAYKCALEEKVDFKSAFNWIYSYEKSLSRELEFAHTDIAFRSALLDAIPALRDIDINTKNEELWAQIQMTKDEHPHWLTYDMMSDGFKSIINIVAEIAYRCIQLNGFLGENAVKETPGIVMIDELDLYLHPHWQRHILKDFQTAFPKMQFMITTHSPFIVQSVESRNIIKLDGVPSLSSPNKLSLEEVVQEEMNVETVRSARYNEMEKVASEYFALLKRGEENTEEAEEKRKRLDEIELEFSDDPAYVALLKMERAMQ